MVRRLAFATAFAFLAALFVLPAAADQRDPRLDGLFRDLQAAPDLAAAGPIADSIWRIWLEHPDDATQEALLLGAAYMNRGDARQAERAFNEAIERDPEFAEAWNKRATLRYLMGDLDGSVADCAQVLKLEPRHFGALAGLGMIHMAVEDWKGAVRWYEAALAANPHMPGVAAGLTEAKRRLKGDET